MRWGVMSEVCCVGLCCVQWLWFIGKLMWFGWLVSWLRMCLYSWFLMCWVCVGGMSMWSWKMIYDFICVMLMVGLLVMFKRSWWMNGRFVLQDICMGILVQMWLNSVLQLMILEERISEFGMVMVWLVGWFDVRGLLVFQSVVMRKLILVMLLGIELMLMWLLIVQGWFMRM